MSEQQRAPSPFEELAAAREALRDGARAAAIERQHRLGKMSARERIGALVDRGSFHEVGALVQPKRDAFGTENLQAPADGVLTGYAQVDGRAIGLCAFDFTVLGGSNGRIGEHKVERIASHCLEHGCALVLLLDGGGHRIQEGLDSRHFAEGSRYFQIAAHLSGWVPTVALVMGPGFAGPSNFAALCDFVVMVRGTSTMGIAGPALVAAATGEVADKESLGSPETQADRNGLADLVADSDEHALHLARSYLGYLPANAAGLPACQEARPPARDDEERLSTVVPDNVRKAYDVKNVLQGICDSESIFELKPTYAPNLVTAFARVGGRPVGIVANQPLHLAGTLDARACEKGAHFVSVCDAFGLPLVYLIDVPGFLVGSEAEDSGLARRSARLLFELGQATVPRISVVMRKGYGLGYIAMCGGRSFDADLCVAWPTAEICAMSIEGAVDVAYARQVSSAADPAARREALIQRFRSQLGPLHAAAHFGIDDVIDPRETRSAILGTLERCTQRKPGREPSQRRHGISPV
ncbi:Methylmalonyl-CoA carboxyltransferase 12S subunit [Variovorax sp. PBL-H6]|uniref:acyl-CoA carboxylase subunit beta n=1 Tax=Variovorax sp. PBL-H6 TaxID=434009 RepID=UPI001317037F|nr:carboxyl transferase domain-containing protein [Variovorax sp. PBL-H6]VTU24902.1 Methylmalonyl-CoA carboxyltransferase 12S subunit [Variovorax sp. PBL-H6]